MLLWGLMVETRREGFVVMMVFEMEYLIPGGLGPSKRYKVRRLSFGRHFLCCPACMRFQKVAVSGYATNISSFTKGIRETGKV